MFGFGGPPLGGRMQSGSRVARSEHGASRAASEEAEEKKQASETRSKHQKYLTDCRSFYSCIYCRTHLANHDDLVSRSFQGNRSRAYLFNKVINTVSGPAVQRALNTGAHAVSDLHCNNCATTIGWKYERAYVESQKYKEGKYIIELAHVVRENRHLEFDKCEMRLAGSPQQQQQQQQQQRLQRLSKREQRRTRCSSTGSSTTNQDEHEQEEEHQLDRLDEPANWDEVDELMFPICEDLIMLAADRSSFSSTRRSLYLDSPAYAWKYPGSASQHCATSGNSISSSASSSTSSPAASSSSSAAAAASSSSSSCAGPSAAAPPGLVGERRPRLDSDTQFSIEADNNDDEQEGRACRACGLEARSFGPQTCCDDEQSECGQMVDASDEQAGCSRANSMEIDDRHFFDCYTDHDISNSQS